MKRRAAIGVICCLAVLAGILGLAGRVMPRGTEQNGDAPPPAKTEKAPPAQIEETPAQLEGSASTEQTPDQPDLLLQLLEAAGYGLDAVAGEQLIIVSSSGETAELYAFSKDAAGGWSQELGPVSGFVGQGGVTDEKAEGDKKTPAGLFGLTEAFGIQENPGTALPYRQVTADSYWVDDPASAFYNQWVEGTEKQDWSSAEHLLDYTRQYAYGVVVDYNRSPAVPGEGSAIFLHCGERATAGCIAVPEETVVQLLLWLQPACGPAILIG